MDVLNVRVAYYSLTDAITGKPSKDYGWEVDTIGYGITAVQEGSTVVVTKNESRKKTLSYKPKEDGAAAISKEAFDALDTSEESATGKLRRERNKKTIDKFLEQAKVEAKGPPTEAIKEMMTKVIQQQGPAFKNNEILPPQSPLVKDTREQDPLPPR